MNTSSTIQKSQNFTQPKNIPITYLWFGKSVPQDYLISLSELDYPVIFLNNPQLNRKFSREILDVQKSDYYRLQFLYQNGGIFSDFDNIVDYPCLMNLLQPYRKQDFLVFMADQKNTRNKTKSMTNNLIFAPYPKMPILKKMLDTVNQYTGKIWKFSGMKFVAQFKQPIQVPMSECINHTGDWSWFDASNKVVGRNRKPHSRFMKKKQKKQQIIAQNQKLQKQINSVKKSQKNLQKSQKSINQQNNRLKQGISTMRFQINKTCPSQKNPIFNKITTSQDKKNDLVSEQNKQNIQQNSSINYNKNQFYFTQKYQQRINKLNEINKKLQYQNKIYQFEFYGIIIILILMILIVLWRLKSKCSQDKKQLEKYKLFRNKVLQNDDNNLNLIISQNENQVILFFDSKYLFKRQIIFLQYFNLIILYFIIFIYYIHLKQVLKQIIQEYLQLLSSIKMILKDQQIVNQLQLLNIFIDSIYLIKYLLLTQNIYQMYNISFEDYSLQLFPQILQILKYLYLFVQIFKKFPKELQAQRQNNIISINNSQKKLSLLIILLLMQQI